MAQVLALNNIVEIKTFCLQGSQQAINVLHYRVSAVGGTSRSDAQVVTDLEAQFAPKYKAWMPSTALWLGVRGQIIFPPPLPVAQVSTANSGVGGRGADGIAPQVAGLITKKTAFAGRANRGRFYAPFFSEDLQTASGQVEAAGAALLTAFANLAFNPITVNSAGNQVTLEPIIWHRQFSASTPITSYTVRTVFATQRRRSLVNRPDIPGP